MARGRALRQEKRWKVGNWRVDMKRTVKSCHSAGKRNFPARVSSSQVPDEPAVNYLRELAPHIIHGLLFATSSEHTVTTVFTFGGGGRAHGRSAAECTGSS